ncbi:MAG: BrnT family toxin [Candidatus Daviesbacteria bacterium]|nr:BrnT family toxin [Candidatus Daviesbacteria bacterium]
MKIPKPIAFDWDKGNTDKNFHKHNVLNRETEEVFSNKSLKMFKDIKHSHKEQRFVAYGVTNLNRKLAIVFTLRKQKIRVISARDQNKKERIIYEESN